MDTRRARLSVWAKRVFSDKRALEDWTMRDLIKASKVGKDTVYALQRGDWTHMPKAVTIEKLCHNLDLPSAEPMEILGYHRAQRTAPEPVRSDVAKKLDRVMHDPNVPADKKRMITDMVMGLITPYLPSKTRPNRHSALARMVD